MTRCPEYVATLAQLTEALYAVSPGFRATVDECAEVLAVSREDALQVAAMAVTEAGPSLDALPDPWAGITSADLDAHAANFPGVVTVNADGTVQA